VGGLPGLWPVLPRRTIDLHRAPPSPTFYHTAFWSVNERQAHHVASLYFCPEALVLYLGMWIGVYTRYSVGNPVAERLNFPRGYGHRRLMVAPFVHKMWMEWGQKTLLRRQLARLAARGGEMWGGRRGRPEGVAGAPAAASGKAAHADPQVACRWGEPAATGGAPACRARGPGGASVGDRLMGRQPADRPLRRRLLRLGGGIRSRSPRTDRGRPPTRRLALQRPAPVAGASEGAGGGKWGGGRRGAWWRAFRDARWWDVVEANKILPRCTGTETHERVGPWPTPSCLSVGPAQLSEK
jgi:hypothetical protein